MKKTSIIKILSIILILALLTYCHHQRYVSLDPHIMILKEDSSFNDSPISSLNTGTSLIIDGKKGQYYHGYFFIEGKKYTGYIPKDKAINYTFDHDFEKTINSFPDSYKQSLRIIHTLYPNWSFSLLNTSLDFDQTASIFQSRSLIDTDTSGLIADSKVLEGSSWRRVSLEAAQYYLDPRNGLDAKHILMFEKKTYNPYESLQLGEKMLENTIMSGIEPQSHKQWAELFRHSAYVNNISMSLLITRAIQEQSGGGLGFTGGKSRNDPQGKTYYNIFNIGANASDQDGIDFASLRDWDTIEKSILYGSKYLADNYITKGQDTLYLQKFDVQANNPGHHYYMSNILAPYSEAKNMFKGYLKNNVMNIKREFLIPAYHNMPIHIRYPVPNDYYHSYSIIQNQNQSYYLSKEEITYKNKKITVAYQNHILQENVDYICVDEGSFYHIEGLNNYHGSFDFQKL